MVAAVVALQDVQETALPLVAEGAATDVILLVAEDVEVVALVNVALPVEGALVVPVVVVDAVAGAIVAALPGAEAPVRMVAKVALENALPVVEAALAAPAALETVLDNVLVGATPTALAAQATARGTVPSRVLTLAPPLVMVLAQSA